MSQEVVQFEGPLWTQEGLVYHAIACGRERPNGSWEGWIEFVSGADGTRIRTDRETTQPDYEHLLYWATGLTSTYLDGALLRSTRVAPDVVPAPLATSVRRRTRARPALASTLRRSPSAVMDPFAVFAEGDEVLRDQLTALGPAQLRNIVRAYGLSAMSEPDLEAATPAGLRTLILAAVRDRTAPG